MKAIVARGYGGPEVLEVQNLDIPVPAKNEILIKVHVASATRADTMMLTGKPYFARLFIGLTKPKNPIPGTGFAGEVVGVGSEVGQFNVGDRVFGESLFQFSSNAEYLAIPEDGVILPIPDSMKYEEAASYCDGPLTSYNFLKNLGKIQPDEKVLIIGASGALGTAAVQLSKYFGAEVTGVSSGRNIGMVQSLGADYVIDYTKEDFTTMEKHYDLIYDTVGKSSFKESKKVLSKDGLYLSPVLNFSLLIDVVFTSFSKGKKAIFDATGARKVDELKQFLAELVNIFQEGKLRSVIDRQFPLEKVRQAHEYIVKGHKRGNVVILVE
ncbi:MAG: NAD(P)-dependent alcohol dehydrogenase [Saprospiraceae bacterium]|nr:NAD(P)-dependent alcohol dehydrogenase [Saprospiraceae bacterium]